VLGDVKDILERVEFVDAGLYAEHDDGNSTLRFVGVWYLAVVLNSQIPYWLILVSLLTLLE